MNCIRVNRKEYKALVDLVGQIDADKLVIANDGDIPPLDHPVVQEILEQQASRQLKSEVSQTAEDRLTPKIKDFLKSIGVSIEQVDQITDEDNSKLPYIAKADLAKKVLQYVEGKSDSSTLPHEAGHFLLAFLPKDHPLYKAMYNNITSFKIYEDVKNEYTPYSKDENPEDSIRQEAIAQLIGQRL